ncbi:MULTISPECIES: cytochrome ubiquinol oxidase subunit I [unclassified Alistipes]|jgi:cytochrome d ubiquinol oxidase subunit I|uniref:cytochrome ubiquinol oxidase subunit I n=1 Tax=unclassified Alistipes TaxID=2608932 RepID=UPI000B3939A1|nr:cytochrome ubiquinol oxidase subunit I [Alistipes sp. An31A]OUO22218.1 cytochrome ubiquinol oxidase subunit I [Alistipes sp. An31A]HIV33417.1 cytochrome ubiquinol oxidase subunit I [Candidatus Alistipes excrementigallinarum]
MSDILQTVDWSRAQFALTAIYHWLFVPLTLGLGVIIAIMESIYYRTGDDFWKRTTRFWMRLFGVNFAIGVATGLILEFEFGTNWSNYSHFVGDIFGAPLAIEGIMAFFLESTFIAVMYFGWGKVSRGFHLTATWLTAIGANLSAWWILVANSWMQYPTGCTFNPETVRNEMTSFWEVAFSPVAVNKFSHTVTSSFTLAALFVVGVSAWYLLKRRERQMATRSIAVASLFGLVASLVTAYSGDRSGAIVARLQPMKLAAMEALYDGCEGAPLTAVGILRPESQRTSDDDAFYFKVDIPKMLSIMSFRDAEAYVAGINDLLRGNPEQGILPAEEKIARGRVAIDELARFRDARQSGDQETVDQITRKFDPSTPEGREFLGEYFAYFGYGYLQSPEQLVPNIPLLFYSFRVMVGAGCLFILMLALVWWYNRRDKLAEKRWLLRLAILCIPLAYLASQAGWVVAEVGRQPWVIQDLMPVGVGVSKLPGESVATTFFIFLALFTALLIAELSILFRQIKAGPGKE